jgi:S1/P1 Nuclease
MKLMDVQEDRAGFGKMLQEEITVEQRSSWLSMISALDWANESLAIARQPNAQYCVLKGARCDYSEDQQEYIPNEHVDNDGKKELHLTSEYENAFGPVVKERIQRAGVRLGAMLNDIFKE